jgi:hypothetical protein
MNFPLFQFPFFEEKNNKYFSEDENFIKVKSKDAFVKYKQK